MYIEHTRVYVCVYMYMYLLYLYAKEMKFYKLNIYKCIHIYVLVYIAVVYVMLVYVYCIQLIFEIVISRSTSIACKSYIYIYMNRKAGKAISNYFEEVFGTPANAGTYVYLTFHIDTHTCIYLYIHIHICIKNAQIYTYNHIYNCICID